MRAVVAMVLLDAGALVEEPNENGHTLLVEAASGGHISEGQGRAWQGLGQGCLCMSLVCAGIGVK